MKKKQTERRKLFRKLNKTFWSWYFRNLYLIFKIPILLKNSQNIGQDMKKYGWCLVIYFIRMPFKTITWGIGQMRKKSIMRNYLGSVLSFCHWIKLFHLVKIYIYIYLFDCAGSTLPHVGCFSCGMLTLSSLTRDWTQAPYSISAQS